MKTTLNLIFLASLTVASLTTNAATPIAQWRFDEGTDVFISDDGPDFYEGIASNTTWVKGDFGTAIKLSGNDSYITLPTPTQLMNASEASLSIWVYWEAGDRQYPNILTSGWNPGGMLIFVTGNSCSFRLGRPGHRAGVAGEKWYEQSSHLISNFPLKTWIHLAVVFKRPIVTTYVNGVQTGTARWDDVIAPANEITLGRWYGPVSHQGLLDNFAIFDKALDIDQIKQLADRKGRDNPNYTDCEDIDNSKPILTLDTRCAAFTISDKNAITSIMQKSPRRELVEAPTPLCKIRLKNGRTLTPRKLSLKGDNLLVAEFSRNLGQITIEAVSKGEYITFTPKEITVQDVEMLTFCAVSPSPQKYLGTMSGMSSDDESGVGVRSLSLKVAMSRQHSPRLLSASSESKYGLTDVSAAIAAGPRSELTTIFKTMEQNEPVPKSIHGGPHALESNLTRGSYLFADLRAADTDLWIKLAKQGGFEFIHLHGWWKTLGHYDINRGYYPNGLEDMKKTVDKIHDAGLKVTCHTLTACIDPRDSWVSPVPSDDLIATYTYTLAKPFAKDDTILYVNEEPGPKHEVIWSYSCNGNAIKIGKEIIQYTEISREEGNYCFKNCTRGAFKTTPQDHAQGAKADYLQQRYIAFYPDPDSKLADDLADAIANVYNTLGLDGIYFDGSEGMMSRYGIDTMRWKIFQRLKNGGITEASCWGHNSWWFHSRLGAWDHPVWANRRNHDAHVDQSLRFRLADLVQPQLGWWAPRGPSTHARGHFPDEMEYFGAKNLSIDGPMSIQSVNVSRNPWNARIQEMMTILGWYERFRMANYFTKEDLLPLQGKKADFRLRMDDNGQWKLTPVAYNWHTATPSSNSWSANNPHKAQPYRGRIEALYTIHQLNQKVQPVLIDFAEIDQMDEKRSKSGQIQQTLSVVTEDTKLAPKNLRIQAVNQSDSSRGAWTIVGKNYPHPYHSMQNGRGFGFWVKGDGSGALLNLQVCTPSVYHGAISDHYVDLDFKGWKYVELLLRERDSDRMADYEWPYSTNAASHAICRNAIFPNALSSVKLIINEIPAKGGVDIIVSPIISIPQTKNNLENLALSVNGKSIGIPVVMQSGDYLELEGEDDCAHYDERGELITRFKPVCPNGWPTMNEGDNSITLQASSVQQALTPRVEVVSMNLGNPFGTRSDKVDWKYLKDEYELPRTIHAQDGLSNKLNVFRRNEQDKSPNDNPKLEIELYVASAGANTQAYADASALVLDSCDNLEHYKASERNDYPKFAFDSENQGTAKPGVTFDTALMKSQYAPNGSLQFNARSARSDTAGWAAIGRRFDKPIDISNGKTLAFWLHGDASGSTFKVQLRDVKGIWHDMTASVSFNGWKYVEFNLAGAKLDLKQVEYILYYYNGLPAGRTIDSATTEGTLVSCAISPVKILSDTSTLDTPTLTINGTSIAFPVKLESGHTLVCEDEVNWIVLDISRKPIAQGKLTTAFPQLKPGPNPAILTFDNMKDETFNARLAIIKHYH